MGCVCVCAVVAAVAIIITCWRMAARSVHSLDSEYKFTVFCLPPNFPTLRAHRTCIAENGKRQSLHFLSFYTFPEFKLELRVRQYLRSSPSVHDCRWSCLVAQA